MKIIVFNGSPKGDMSVTMQYVHFIQKKYPQHEMTIYNISERIRKIEKDERSFQEVIEGVKSSDGVLWAFPLYIFVVPSQYKRFIELISERNAEAAFQNKYAVALTTSVHINDHTAHNYLNAICDDLGMRYVGFFSADMNDLLKEKERERLTLFAENFFYAVKKDAPTPKAYGPLTHETLNYLPGPVRDKVDAESKKIVVITDCQDTQSNLARMADRFKESFSGEVEVVNLHDLDIKGGCLDCIQCGYDYRCVYTGKDGFIDFYNTKVKTADILVFAGTIRDRYLSSTWKLFFDRSFFNTHTPTLTGKQLGFIISGPLRQIPNLRQMMEAWAQWQQASLVDFITDEYENSVEIDALLQSLAERLVRFKNQAYMKSETFLGVGVWKMLRDEIWGRLRFPFQADHKYYKEHWIYEFPQKDYRARIRNSILIALTKIPSMRREIYVKGMKGGAIKELQKQLNRC